MCHVGPVSSVAVNGNVSDAPVELISLWSGVHLCKVSLECRLNLTYFERNYKTVFKLTLPTTNVKRTGNTAAPTEPLWMSTRRVYDSIPRRHVVYPQCYRTILVVGFQRVPLSIAYKTWVFKLLDGFVEFFCTKGLSRHHLSHRFYQHLFPPYINLVGQLSFLKLPFRYPGKLKTLDSLEVCLDENWAKFHVLHHF